MLMYLYRFSLFLIDFHNIELDQDGLGSLGDILAPRGRGGECLPPTNTFVTHRVICPSMQNATYPVGNVVMLQLG